MRVVQIGSNKGNDDLSRYLKKHYEQLDFGLFVEVNPLHIGDLKKCYDCYVNVFFENVGIKTPSCKEDTLRFFIIQKMVPYMLLLPAI